MGHLTATRRSPGLPTVLTLALGLAGGVTPIYLQAASAEQAQVYRFEIAGQSLDSALTAFSSVTRLQVLVSADVTQGVQSPGVKGSYSRNDALAQLLGGTGLVASFIDDDSVTLQRPVDNGSALELGATKVGAQRLHVLVLGGGFQGNTLAASAADTTSATQTH